MRQRSLNVAGHQLLGWAQALVDAVDHDNSAPPMVCRQTRTLPLLEAAPMLVRQQTGLAVKDFAAAADASLTGLRSDTVCDRFLVRTDRPNVLVGRMTVPGGPWPGHYGLEAVCFDAEPAVMPGWFPATLTDERLAFGAVRVASKAFAQGSGAVLFPEQLSVRRRTPKRAFGVVFIDKLADLFLRRVTPLVGSGPHGLDCSDSDMVRRLRRFAFLAHEWGHVTDAAVAQTVLARRLAAVIGELHADLGALVMLLATGTSLARQAARVLTFDRVVREAWLPRPHAQVNAIAARHLLQLLLGCRAIDLDGAGRLVIDLDASAPWLQEELQAVRRIAAACSHADLEPARSYLRRHGWRLEGDKCSLALSGPVVEALADSSHHSRSA